MTKMDLLFRLYLDEDNEQGFMAVRDLLTRTRVLEVTTFTAAVKRIYLGTEHQSIGEAPLNIMEGILYLDRAKQLPDQGGSSEIDFRYRPSLNSRRWQRLDISDPASPEAGVDAETFQLFLSLVGFERSATNLGNRSEAVFELLCRSVPATNTLEKTIVSCLTNHCRALLGTRVWGYADVVPFRQLSVEEEWQVARTDVLWADLSVTADAQHQYLLCGDGAKPSVVIPGMGVREDCTVVFKLKAQQ